jgi:hypothetical protein
MIHISIQFDYNYYGSKSEKCDGGRYAGLGFSPRMGGFDEVALNTYSMAA